MTATNIDQLKKISEKPWFYPVALLLIGFIAYGYVLTSLGYYWADWEIVMFTKLNPALQFEYYAHDRPFPWTYQLIYFLVGSKPIGWQIATLLLRWAGTLFFVWALRLIWPRYKKHFLWLGALLLVYPGFLQQLQSATKARHIMTFLLFALSLYLMALAIRYPKWARILFPLSWFATFVHLFTTEYFFSLEVMRPVLLWILLGGTRKKDWRLLRQVAVTYLPYFLITVFFVWCRFFYFPVIFKTTSRIGDINSTLGELQASFPGSLVGLLNRVLLDLLHSTLLVWPNAILDFSGFSFQSLVAWLAFALGIGLTLAFAFFHDPREEEVTDGGSPAQLFVVGLGLFMLGALPAWAIGKDLSTGGWNDRFTLAAMLGAGLMMLALVLWLVRPAGQRLVLGFLLVFSIAAQVWNVNVYRRDWRTQLDYYWQLYWRAPSLQPGTAVFTFEQPSPFVTHYSDAGYALNVLYHYQTEDGSLPYWFFSRRYHFEYQPDDAFSYDLRGLIFKGNTSKGVAIFHQTGSVCLRALDTVYQNDPRYTEGQDVLIPISDVSRIVPDPAAAPPDPDIFGPEPAHTWCYFFEKADLARQTKDWDSVIALYKQAQQKGFTPGYGAEYVPLIEAYAQTGNWQKAYELTLTAHKMVPGLKKMLCTNWSSLQKIPAADMQMVEKVDQSLACTKQ